MELAIEASTWINTRGYGRFTREMTRALQAVVSIDRLTLVVDSGAAAATDLPDLPRVVVPTRRAVVDAATTDGARSPSDLWRMAARLSRFDAVIFPTLYSFVPLWGRASIAVVVHDALPEAMPALVLGSRRARWLWLAKSWAACRQADVLATVSEASAQEIRRRLPVGDRLLTVLTEGPGHAFSARATPADERLIGPWIEPGSRTILYVGGLSPHKRVADLVRAFGAVAGRDGFDDVRLVLVGAAHEGFASERADVEAAVASLGVAGTRVRQTGFVPDDTLAAMYRHSSCVVLPSLAEGFGLPAIEAMASGAPLIVSRIPALEEVCGEAADYLDDIARLPGQIMALLADDGRRRALSRAGVARAAGFSWTVSAERLLAALHRTRGTAC